MLVKKFLRFGRRKSDSTYQCWMQKIANVVAVRLRLKENHQTNLTKQTNKQTNIEAGPIIQTLRHELKLKVHRHDIQWFCLHFFCVSIKWWLPAQRLHRCCGPFRSTAPQLQAGSTINFKLATIWTRSFGCVRLAHGFPWLDCRPPLFVPTTKRLTNPLNIAPVHLQHFLKHL